MNTIRSFIRHVLEEHNVLNRLIMQEGEDSPPGQKMPSGLEQSLSYPVVELDQEYRERSAILTKTLQTNSSVIITNVNDMFGNVPQPGGIITEQDELRRAVAILKLLNDDWNMTNIPDIEFPYNTALFVIGWENGQQSPSDTLKQMSYNVSKILESSHDSADKLDPDARGISDATKDALGLSTDEEVQVPGIEADPEEQKVVVPDNNFSAFETAVLSLGGATFLAILGSAGGFKLIPAILKHATVEKLVKGTVRAIPKLEPTGKLQDALDAVLGRALAYMKDPANAAIFKSVYATAIKTSTGTTFDIILRRFNPEFRDMSIKRINQLLSARSEIELKIAAASKELLTGADSTISKKIFKKGEAQSTSFTPPTLLANIDTVTDIPAGTGARLAKVLSIVEDSKKAAEAEADIVYNLIRSAAGGEDSLSIARMTDAELIAYFKEEIKKGLDAKLAGSSDDTKEFARILNYAETGTKAEGSGLIEYILSNEDAVKNFPLSASAENQFNTLAKQLRSRSSSTAEISALLFKSMIRSADTFGSGGLAYWAGTKFYYTLYAVAAAASVYLQYETYIGSDSNNTVVSEEDAKILLTDLHIRASASESMKNISSAGWWRNPMSAGAEQFPLRDADNELEKIFASREAVTPDQLQKAMIVYRAAIKTYNPRYVEELGKELDIEEVNLQAIDNRVDDFQQERAAAAAEIKKRNAAKK
jgi:hypothetical protein